MPNFIQEVELYKENLTDLDEIKIAEELLYRAKTENDFLIRTKRSGKVDIAGSVILFTEKKYGCLLLYHNKIKRWVTPGGHADGEKNLKKVAFQELKEEVGIKIDDFMNKKISFIHKFDYPKETFGYKKSIINIFYTAICPEDQIPKIMEPSKCSGIDWFSKAKVEELALLYNSKALIKLVDLWDNLI